MIGSPENGRLKNIVQLLAVVRRMEGHQKSVFISHFIVALCHSIATRME